MAGTGPLLDDTPGRGGPRRNNAPDWVDYWSNRGTLGGATTNRLYADKDKAGRLDGRRDSQRGGTVFQEGAIQMTVHNPRPETVGQTLNSRMRVLAAFGLFDNG